MQGYLTLDQLAIYLGVASTGSLRTQIARGALKAERVGKRTFLVSVVEAQRYNQEHRAAQGRRGRPPKRHAGATIETSGVKRQMFRRGDGIAFYIRDDGAVRQPTAEQFAAWERGGDIDWIEPTEGMLARAGPAAQSFVVRASLHGKSHR